MVEIKEIKINLGIELVVDDVIVNFIGYEDDFDVLVFVCGDVVFVFV